MKVSLLDADKLIAVNRLEEVSSPRLYTSGKRLFDPEGILSNEIFGLNRSDRRSTFAYVDLVKPFIHPHVYQGILKRLCNKVVYIIAGTRKYKIINGVLTEDETGWTGITKLYENWDKIDWNKSSSTNERSLKLLKMSTRDEIFIRKWVIIPPGYRDVTMAGSGTGDTSDHVPEINNFYKDLIKRVAGLQTGGILAERQCPLEASIQDLLVTIYDEFKNQIAGKTGYIKRYLMGKSINYGTRAVISAPSYNNETIQDNMVDIEHTALPIAQCCATFKPFITAYLKNFFHREIVNNPNIARFIHIKTGKEIFGTVKDPEIQFNERVIEKIIKNFVKNPDSRFSLIEVQVEIPTDKPKQKDTVVVGLVLKGKEILPDNRMVDLKRPMTITDLLYLACVESCEKRHIMISRYPVGTDKGIFFSRVRVQSTKTHIKIVFNGTEYKFYPNIDLTIPREYVGVEFVDTCVYSNSLLKGMGGDYDGDQVSVRGLWSDEANSEASEIMNRKMTALNIMGGDMRFVENEVINSYYELTRIGPKSAIVKAADQTTYLSLEPDQFTRSLIVRMLADTVDASEANQIKKRKATHQTWDGFTVPANYFFDGQKEIETTVGRFLMNKYVLQGAGVIHATGFIDREINGGALRDMGDLIGQLYLEDKITREQFNRYVDRRDNLGYWLNGMLAHTISLRMSKPLKEIEAKKAELFKKYAKEIEARNIDVMVDIQNQLVAYAKEILKDDPGMNLYNSGDLNFGNNYRSNSILKGPVLNNITGEYDFIETSYMNGLRIEDLPAHANSIVAGAFPSAIMTREAGYLGKQLLALLQMSEVDEAETDCGTKNLVPIKVFPKGSNTPGNANELIYSYFRKDDGLELLTKANVAQYYGKTLWFRSPMTCTTTLFCSKCVGELAYKLGIKQIGLYAVQLSHSDLNLALKAKHNQTVSTTYLDPDKIVEEL
jgi:DNA-directed RNA polymerase beta' subunit